MKPFAKLYNLIIKRTLKISIKRSYKKWVTTQIVTPSTAGQDAATIGATVLHILPAVTIITQTTHHHHQASKHQAK